MRLSSLLSSAMTASRWQPGARGTTRALEPAPLLDVELLELAVEAAEADAELLRGERLVPLAALERLQDVLPLELEEAQLGRRRGGDGRRGLRRGGPERGSRGRPRR